MPATWTGSNSPFEDRFRSYPQFRPQIFPIQVGILWISVKLCTISRVCGVAIGSTRRDNGIRDDHHYYLGVRRQDVHPSRPPGGFFVPRKREVDDNS